MTAAAAMLGQRAARAGVDKKQCYALVFDDAEVAALWNGTAFQIIHLDDVRKPK